MSKKILIVVANPSVNTNLGWPVGFWASELTHPFEAFKHQGYEITIASPDGGKVEWDGESDPRPEGSYSAWDELSKTYLNDAEFLELLENTPSVSDLNVEDYDALLIAGGQSPMFTFDKAKNLHSFFSRFYESGKTTAALCHGTAILRYVKNGELIKGKTVTGFSNPEEDAADQAVGQTVMPWRIEDELTRLGANFKKADVWESFAVRDGHLITGQQQMSGTKTAELIIETLEA
ncbi:type 1 glutamine amidotransferase domain-containing protein [Fulvivirgaceae bacterium BMA12]|uniref:Type 1 glutamine amidotransferase domain-containing protein n=1 Tax=Agaribacillus aureus TaxID=3051825 RepID=A0ABT8L5P3_9BACT|nr:type 1 glutamine amidotransferase domain-containing protein [Fulvivirgaceae bacterium BMA12]